jgi:hypothetical protein
LGTIKVSRRGAFSGWLIDAICKPASASALKSHRSAPRLLLVIDVGERLIGVRGYRVCRMHGARGGAPEGKRNGNYRHGYRTRKTIETKMLIAAIRKKWPL